jgi:hypothetical protein
MSLASFVKATETLWGRWDTFPNVVQVRGSSDPNETEPSGVPSMETTAVGPTP